MLIIEGVLWKRGSRRRPQRCDSVIINPSLPLRTLRPLVPESGNPPSAQRRLPGAWLSSNEHLRCRVLGANSRHYLAALLTCNAIQAHPSPFDCSVAFDALPEPSRSMDAEPPLFFSTSSVGQE